MRLATRFGWPTGRAIGAFVTLVVLSQAGCRRALPAIEIDEEENAGVASSIDGGDERAASQFVSGFHDVEASSYRWTMGKFSVVLQPPPSPAARNSCCGSTCPSP